MSRLLYSLYWLLLLNAVLLCLSSIVLAADDFEQQRLQLIEQIKSDIQQSADYLGKDQLDAPILAAIAKVPRHEFVPIKYRHQAYKNRALPIGYGQTISQPSVVAMMTDLLQLKQTDRVLEIGTGSGYQAAVLAELVDDVYSIEIVEGLAKQARVDLDRLGYTRVHIRQGDGYYGWQDEQPFDAIIVTATSSHIPPALIKQLKVGGRMIIPVGGRFMLQHLVLVNKNTEENITTRQIVPVKFVPLLGQH